MPAGSILAEFRRRKIPQAAAIYVAVAWGVTEIVVTVVEQLFLPQWVSTLAVIGFVVGFPVAMFLAWTFDITSSGIQRTEVTSRRGRASIATSIVLLIAGTAGLFLLIRPSMESGRDDAIDIPPNSLAVLPFESTSPDPNDSWLIEGLGDELRDQLARTPGLRIAARSSSVSAQHRKLDARTTSKLLGVANLIEGRFHRQGTRVRVAVHLIEGKSGLALWSENFYGAPDELLDLQHEIVEQIVQFTLPGATEIAEPATRNVDANALMWRARRYVQQVRDREIRNDDTLREAVRLYREATEADPGSALAHSRLASALLYLGELEAAEEPIFQALKLDSELSEVHNTVGEWYWAVGDPGAKRAWAQAIELDPDNADALHNYAYARFLSWDGGDYVDENEALFRRALEIDPLSLARYAALGDFLGQQGRDDKVRDVIGEIEKNFDSAGSYRLIAWLREVIGELDQAIAWTIRARDREPANPDHVHKLAELYAELGDFQTSEKLDPQPGPGVLLLMRRYDEAIDQAQDLMLEDPSDVDVRFILASAYNATGQYELARHVLESTGLLDSMLENRVRSLSEMNAFVTLFNALAGIGTDMSVEMARSLAELNDSSTWHGDAAAVAVGRSCTLAVMGRHEEALALLPDARRGKRLIGIQWLKDAWCFQQYTNEPEYQEVLQDQEELRQRLLDRLPATLEAFGVKL